MTKKNKRPNSSLKQFIVLALISTGLVAATYFIKIAQNLAPKAASKPAAPIFINSRVFWPTIYDYIETPAGITNLGQYIVGNKIIFTQPLPTYYAYFGAQLGGDGTTFQWVDNPNPNLETTAMLYGYTTANCDDGLNFSVNVVPVVDGEFVTNQDISLVPFADLPSEYCGQDPTRANYRWFKMPSDGLGTANNFSGPITQLGIIVWPTNSGNKTWEISKVVVCNPKSDESGCDLEPWPQPRQLR